MPEVKITWTEDTKVPSIYHFDTLREAKHFYQGITEVESKLIMCPKIFNIEKGNWKQEPEPDMMWGHFLFSLFVGAWSAVWWGYLNTAIRPEIEYVLIGFSVTLVVFLVSAIYRLIKRKKKNKK